VSRVPLWRFAARLRLRRTRNAVAPQTRRSPDAGRTPRLPAGVLALWSKHPVLSRR
jgi:hypothetical protein